MVFEVGLPRKLCRDKKEMLKFVNTNNGKKAIYKTVYEFNGVNLTQDKPDYNTAIIDKLFFDFDGEDAWSEANRLHQELNKLKLRHKINMSGGGYHLFIFCDVYSPENPKSCLYNAQMHFVNMLKLKCDSAVIGDVARLHRIENTFNVKKKRFCIPVKETDFGKGDAYCKGIATRQQFAIHITFMGGDKLLDIKKFDFKSKDEPQIFVNTSESSSDNIVIKNLLPCIEELLKNKNLNYKGRYMIILYFREKGYTKKEIMEILKQHLSEKKFRHCILEEKQLQYLWERDDLLFPICEKIRKDGYCISGCTLKEKLNIYKV